MAAVAAMAGAAPRAALEPGEPDRWLFIGLLIQNDASQEQHELLVEEARKVQKCVGPDRLRDEDIKHKVTWERAIGILGSGGQSGYDVVVIAGHATEDGLKFGQTIQPQTRILASLLAQMDSLQLLILNCCNTEELGSAVLKERRRQEKSGVVVLCWSTEVDFQGAATMNERFCHSIMQQLCGNSICATPEQKRRKIFRVAFQQAIMETAGKGFTVGPIDQVPVAMSPESHPLGEPMLLPFFSTQAGYHDRMLAKYKVAETGIELIKRLKSIVKFAYLRGNSVAAKPTTTAGILKLAEARRGGFDAKLTTLYHFGEFLAWLQLMREEDSVWYMNEKVSRVEFAFSGEYWHLRDGKAGQTGAQAPTGGLLQRDASNHIGDFATTVYPGCFTLYTMDIKAIAEVMRDDPGNRYSIRRFINFEELWRRGEGFVMDSAAAGSEEDTRLEEVAELRDAFTKLEADLDLVSFSPRPLPPPSRQSWDTYWGAFVGCALDRLIGGLALRNLPFIRAPLPPGNPLYVTPPNARRKEAACVRRDANVYRRIAWIHDSVLELVSALDPSIKADIKDDELFFHFTQLDRDLFGRSFLGPRGRALFGASFGARVVRLGAAALALAALARLRRP